MQRPGGSVSQAGVTSSDSVEARPHREDASGSGHAIRGFVRAESGGIISGALVCAMPALSHVPVETALKCTRSDASGGYVLGALVAGRYQLTASSQGFASASANRGQPILLQAGEPHWEDIVLREGGAVVEGAVVDALGGPVAQARVRLLRFLPDSREGLELLTDDEGRFQASTTAGSNVLVVSAEGYATTRVVVVAPERKLQVVLMPGASIQGTVVDTRSQDPVPEIEVRAVLANTNPTLGPVAQSDDEGRFEIRGLQPGIYRLLATGANARGQGRSSIEVVLGTPVRDAVVEVDPAVQVVGKVLVAPEQQPCEKGIVSVGPPDPSLRSLAKTAVPVDPKSPPVPSLVAPVEHDGSVHLRGLTPGTYQVLVQCLGRVLRAGPEMLRVEQQGIRDVVWEMEEGLGISVNVVDSAERPVPGASVFLRWPKAEGGASGMMMLTADEKGHYEVPKNLYPGEYTLIPAAGYEGDPVSVSVRERALAKATLRLRGSAFVDVEVTREDGEPAEGVRVYASRLADRSAQGGDEPSKSAAMRVMAAARGDGRFAVGPLAVGSYAISVEDGLNPPSAGKVVVLGEATRVNTRIALVRDASLVGRVVDPAGEPVVGLAVTARYEVVPEPSGVDAAGGKQVFTDLEGAFTFTGLESGARFVVRAEQTSGAVAVQHNVSPGTPLTLALAAKADADPVVPMQR